MSTSKYFTEMVRAFLTIMEERDVTIRRNSERIARLAQRFCKYIDLSKGESGKIYLASLLHDIGMIYMPTEIIHKPEKLTEGEWAMVKMHPDIGVKVVANLSFMNGIIPIIRHHHESDNGSGYPDALQGDEIPLCAKILRLVDCYDAMMHGRPYKPPINKVQVLKDIETNMGMQFDKKLAEDFIGFAQLNCKIPEVTSADKPLRAAYDGRDTINKIVQNFKDGKIELPVLPRVISQIQKEIRNPLSTADDVAKLIERDAVISSRLLFVANTAFHRGKDKIKTIRQAVPRLGIKQAQSVLTAIANKNLYTSGNDFIMGLLEELWFHSLACAYAAKAIAEMTGNIDEESLFMLGLLHDIGAVLLIKAVGDIMPQSESVDAAKLLEHIRQVHCDFGSALLKRWRFPQIFVLVAKMHDEEVLYDSAQKDVLIVHLANQITRKIGFSFYSQADFDLAALPSATLLGLGGAAIDTLCQQVEKNMQESADVF